MKVQAKPSDQVAQSVPRIQKVYAAAFGAFLGLSLVKFGNPPIFEQYVTPPENLVEFLIVFPWPIRWAYCLLAFLVIGAVFAGRRRLPGAPIWLTSLPAAWAIWQFASAIHSVDSTLSGPTVLHLTACVVCFYLGLFCLRHDETRIPLLAGVAIGFVLALATAFEQQFGGLEQTRQYFRIYIYPQLKDPAPEYLKKMASNRVFGTLFYPNALAGMILLVLPPLLCRVAQARARFTFAARMFIVGLLTVASFACLVWSGSKGGWLLLLLLGFIAILQIPFQRRLKAAAVILVLILGCAGFGIRYASYFRKGSTSVVARLDYWSAALRTAAENPLWGTGPGTFAKPYARIKKPQSEMARLTHNDYLEQASDSGWPAFFLYTGFVVSALAYGAKSFLKYRGQPYGRNPTGPTEDIKWQNFALWLGVLGWALQCTLEFSLYIPALAWPAFAFLGLLTAVAPEPRREMD